MNKEKIMTMEEIEKGLNALVSGDAIAANLPNLARLFKVEFKKAFMAIESVPERQDAFEKMRERVKAKNGFDEMTPKAKSAVKTRLWRLGKLIGLTIGKTPVKKTGKPPRNPPPPVDGNGNGNDMADSLGAKAPKERERAWRLLAQVIKEKTGWRFDQFIKEVGPIFKSVLG